MGQTLSSIGVWMGLVEGWWWRGRDKCSFWWGKRRKKKIDQISGKWSGKRESDQRMPEGKQLSPQSPMNIVIHRCRISEKMGRRGKKRGKFGQKFPFWCWNPILETTTCCWGSPLWSLDAPMFLGFFGSFYFSLSPNSNRVILSQKNWEIAKTKKIDEKSILICSFHLKPLLVKMKKWKKNQKVI